MYIFKHLNIYTYISKDGSNQEEAKKDEETNIRCNNGNMTTDCTGVMIPIEDNSIQVVPVTWFYIINLLFIINLHFSR